MKKQRTTKKIVDKKLIFGKIRYRYNTRYGRVIENTKYKGTGKVFVRMKIIVCDDEPFFLDMISEYCDKFVREDKVPVTLLKFTRGEDVLSYYKENKGIDLFVLDIKMKGVDGLQVAEAIRQDGGCTKLVFLTSAIEYAPKGYEFGASRYWMKPLLYEKFRSEMRILYKEIQKESGSYIVENVGTNIEKVYFDDILYIETSGRKACVHKLRSSYISATKLVAYEQMLDERFYRCHAAYIVNMSYISRIEGTGIFLSNKEKIYMSKGRRRGFLTALSEYFSNEALRCTSV